MKNKIYYLIASLLIIPACLGCQKNSFVITFDSNGGSSILSQTIQRGEKASKPDDPTKEGFIFVSWFDNNQFLGEEFNFDTEITQDYTLYAKWIEIKTLEEYSWTELKEISTLGYASTLFNVGETKKLQMPYQDLNNNGKIDEGEVYQTVRIIGLNEDYETFTENTDPDGDKWIKTDPIGITFEFVDLLSDANGYSIATFWNNTNNTTTANFNYFDSSMRKALNGEGKGDLHWFEIEDSTYSKTYTNSVLSMLPSELSSVLATPSKLIPIVEEGMWYEKIVKDKIFLLSPREMLNVYSEQEANAVTYSYYEFLFDKENRVKNQIKKFEGAIGQATEVEDGEFVDSKYSYAGLSSGYPDGGGFYWLRSPVVGLLTSSWSVYDNGDIISYDNVYASANAIAPCFCI